MLVDKVIEEENVKILPEATDALVKLSRGDMRRALNVLQACHASSKFGTTPQDLSVAFTNRTRCDRHTPTAQKRPQNPRKRNRPRNHHDRDDIQLHRRPSARRHPRNPRHPPKQPGCHVVPEHHQHAQDGARARARRHYYGAVGGDCEAGGQARGHDSLA